MTATDSSNSTTRVVVLMGVAGVGKTSVGTAVAERFGWEFHDADDFHPPENVEKMRRGIPLTDDDRQEWLQKLRQLIRRHLNEGRSAVVACSALKERYRDYLREGNGEAVIVYLRAAQGVVAKRMKERSGHYFGADLLASQYAALEEPVDAVTVDAAQPLDVVIDDVSRVLENLSSQRP